MLDSEDQVIFLNKLAKSIIGPQNFSTDVACFIDLEWLQKNPEFSNYIKNTRKELEASKHSNPQMIRIEVQGNQKWFDFSIDFISCKGCEDKTILVQGIDRTKQLEEKTNANLFNQRLDSHKNQTKIAMVEWDKNLKVIDWNLAAQEIFGYKQLDTANITPHDLYHFETGNQKGLDLFLQSFIDDTTIHCVIEVITKQKEVKTCDWYNSKLLDNESNVIGYTSIIFDVTSDLKMLQQVQQTEKMLALNSVVGGVVHDFNNILMVVLGYADLINILSPEANVSKYANGIYKATERGMRLAKKLNSFLQRHSEHSEDLILSKVLDDTRDILTRAVGSSVSINFDSEEDEWLASCDKDDFEDAILNMCINSAYAMNKSGTIDIAVSNVKLVESEALEIGLKAGDFVLVRLSDTGIGMTKEVVNKVLEPYFTTKGTDGSGLGLCQVYGFMKRSQGSLQIRSYPNEGTRIYLFFPRAMTVLDQDDSIIKDKASKKLSNILIVDDNKDLGFLYSEILKNHGYNAISKISSYDAISYLETNNVDVLITDIVMPEMNGYQLAEWVSKHKPSVKVQLMSGFTKSKYIQASNKTSGLTQNILDKPISTYTLVQRVWELVDVIFCDKLATGIKEVDDDHQTLIEMINSLHHIDENQDPSKLDKVLNELTEYCDYHFKREEALMDKYNYPDKDTHKSAHDAFSKSIEKFCLGINKDCKMLSKYLLSWLTKHIATVDKELSEHIASNTQKT